MRIRYKISAVVITALLLLTLAGCGNNGNNPESAGPTETVSASVDPSPAQPSESAKETGFDVGDIMSDFSVPMVGGGTFTLSENLGKPVFINVYATWCPPCVGEMPEINKLYTELGDQVTFIAIDLGEDEATAQNFADTNSYTLPFAYSLDGAPFGADYNFDYIPQTFVLSANGTIVWSNIGASDYKGFKAAIDAALAQ